MSTTTIRLPEDLKSRVASAAERVGTTAHGFILQAIAEKIDKDEKCRAFDDLAEQRYAAIVASGKTIPWNQMRTYLEGRVKGSSVSPPAAKKLVL